MTNLQEQLAKLQSDKSALKTENCKLSQQLKRMSTTRQENHENRGYFELISELETNQQTT